MGKGDFLRKAVITLSGSFGQPFETINRWVRHAEGTCNKAFSDDTTHLVMSKEVWDREPAMLKGILLNKAVKIVSYDWLDDSLKARRKVGTKKYEWENIDKVNIKKKKQREKIQARERKKMEKASKPRSKLWQAFDEETESYIAPNEKDLRDAKRTFAGLAGVAPTKLAQKLVKATKKTSFLDRNHVYKDETGFAHDIVLFKVEKSLNVNERMIITIYESNEEPITYACYVKVEGPHLLSKPARAVVEGSNKPTAVREFREQFEEATKVVWDLRQKHFPFRKPGEPLPSTKVTEQAPTEADIKAGGGATLERSKPLTEERMKAFAEVAFRYKNPPEGEPQGLIPAWYTIEAIRMASSNNTGQDQSGATSATGGDQLATNGSPQTSGLDPNTSGAVNLGVGAFPKSPYGLPTDNLATLGAQAPSTRPTRDTESISERLQVSAAPRLFEPVATANTLAGEHMDGITLDAPQSETVRMSSTTDSTMHDITNGHIPEAGWTQTGAAVADQAEHQDHDMDVQIPEPAKGASIEHTTIAEDMLQYGMFDKGNPMAAMNPVAEPETNDQITSEDTQAVSPSGFHGMDTAGAMSDAEIQQSLYETFGRGSNVGLSGHHYPERTQIDTMPTSSRLEEFSQSLDEYYPGFDALGPSLDDTIPQSMFDIYDGSEDSPNTYSTPAPYGTSTPACGNNEGEDPATMQI